MVATAIAIDVADVGFVLLVEFFAVDLLVAVMMLVVLLLVVVLDRNCRAHAIAASISSDRVEREAATGLSIVWVKVSFAVVVVVVVLVVVDMATAAFA